MTKRKRHNILDAIAIREGYKNRFDLLMDYNALPMARPSKHKKFELVQLMLNYFRKR